MKKIKKELAEKIGEALGEDVDFEDIEIPDSEYGDFAFPLMKVAEKRSENPIKVGEKAKEKLVKNSFIDKIEVRQPGYLNFYLDKASYTRKVSKILEKPRMGLEEREGNIIIEFSSPNVAKPMHVGHFRNNVLGDSLQRIMSFVGYNVTSENYLGDWGTQYGKLIYAFKEYGSEEKFRENPMEHMYDLYVKFHEEMDEDERMEEKGREWAAKIEKGDEEALKMWEKFREASIEYHKNDYQRMGIEFDRWTGESEVVEESRNFIEDFIEEGELSRDEDGSVYLEFDEDNLPGTVLLKSDGSTLYITRDLYNLKKRSEEGFDYNMYVVGSEQELHFKQVFAAAEELGLNSTDSEHISYGLLSLPEGSMSSREGRIIRLEDAMDEAVKRAEEKAEEKIENQVENAEEIGIGALKYANLRVSRKKDIEFRWEDALSFEGDSGPYLQYSNVRCKSILGKADEEGKLKGEIQEEEYELIKKLGEFPEKIDRAVNQREPAKLANYLSLLCEGFNSFYHSCPVLEAEEKTKKRRLKILELFERVTDNGLELLGIEPLEKM